MKNKKKSKRMVRVKFLDACNHMRWANMTLAEYHYIVWCNKHKIISVLLGIYTFESPYWLYFRIKYR